jgi:hypothetical protein
MPVKYSVDLINSSLQTLLVRFRIIENPESAACDELNWIYFPKNGNDLIFIPNKENDNFTES